MKGYEDLVGVVLDIPRDSCRVHWCLDPTDVSISEFIIDSNDLEISTSDAFELLDRMLDTHITFGYRDPM